MLKKNKRVFGMNGNPRPLFGFKKFAGNAHHRRINFNGLHGGRGKVFGDKSNHAAAAQPDYQHPLLRLVKEQSRKQIAGVSDLKFSRSGKIDRRLKALFLAVGNE